MKKRISLVSMTFILLLAFAYQTVGLTDSSFEEVIGDPLVPGTISIGTLPENPEEDKPVIVFVQGLTNNSTTWYQDNDMYTLAQEEGYETAFVELYDSGGSPKSYWDNGEMLANQLEDISEYFNGKKLVIVGYSKGGVDAQVALIYEGKHPLVSDVVTIGSPHHGSELADLANSTSLGWLANLIGQNSEGTQSLQTGVMNHFRAETDSRWETQQNNYYTIAGTRAGPLFSSYWWGGTVIPGESDGVVSLESTHLPYGNMLAIRNWNHGEVHKGSNALPIFKDHLSTSEPMENVAYDHMFEASNEEDLDLLVRGGAQFGSAEESFFVENEVEKITVNWMSATELDKVEITKPGTKETVMHDVEGEPDTEYFAGAWHHTIEIDNPKNGEWKIRTHTEEESAYGLIVNFDSKLNNQMSFVEDRDKKNWKYETDFAAANSNRNLPFEMFYEIDFVPSKGTANRQIGHKIRDYKQSQKQNENNRVTIPERGEGSYNATIDIEGVTPSGDKFQRTIIKSIYIDDQGEAY
ncbi:esterase/lipase family protein [Salipaludibacillus daqingensis]|uniref:esterase/lipase family protein n=1 Tax=Salipaludibacillus daqingensis TaxID=3041001 RepID=UPI0024771A6C|nr:alpha/beta fold hydrolase [Salipaludibacillus daqingensis]